MDRNYISLVELGKNSPSMRLVFRLGDAFDITPSERLKDVEAHADPGSSLKSEARRKHGISMHGADLAAANGVQVVKQALENGSESWRSALHDRQWLPRLNAQRLPQELLGVEA